jgi:processive 1,2-diacylglycerol beta-glucosyltransferase
MITLFDKQTERRIGEISEGELQFLIDELEEEDRHDKDYYVDAATLDYFATRHATPHLLALLREALGLDEGIEIRWEDDAASAGAADIDDSV